MQYCEMDYFPEVCLKRFNEHQIMRIAGLFPLGMFSKIGLFPFGLFKLV